MSEIAGLNQTHMTTLAAFGNNMKQPSYVYGTNNWANHKKIIIHYNYNLKQDKLWLYWDSYRQLPLLTRFQRDRSKVVITYAHYLVPSYPGLLMITHY